MAATSVRTAVRAVAGESGRALPPLSAESREQLAALDDRELLQMVRALPRSSEPRAAACDLLVTRYRGLVRSCVSQYSHSPEAVDDLMQVGYVGLLKAINNFDPARGFGLGAYGRPCITGEIKRHFRDKRWQVHVERRLQELVLEVREATRSLAQERGHLPSDAELAGYLGVLEADIRAARAAELVLQPVSLDEPLHGQPGTFSLADQLGEEDPRLEHILSMRSVGTHWPELPARERQVLVLRFHGGQSQAQIGQQLGISQVHVSRLLAHALGYLRDRLLGLPERASDAVLSAAPGISLLGSESSHRRPTVMRSVSASGVAAAPECAVAAGAGPERTAAAAGG
jgi:RNA polymerase sigma-B factor